jgi:signal transduction histidine kinase
MLAGFRAMLTDERTTQRNELPLPSEVEGLVVAPGRAVTRALVGFLREQGINVRTAADADRAFEEALLHPPDVVLIDDRVPPSGGIDLCHRLKANARTHFVPVILCALNDLRQYRVRAFTAGADAVFAPTTEAQERRARLWALLRTRALYRRVERRQRTAKSEIVERRHWLSLFLHDLKGQVAAIAANVDYLARFAPAAGDSRRQDFEDSVDDTRGVFEQLKSAVRTVLDYDRFETGQLVLREARFSLGEIAAEVVDGLRRHATLADKSLVLRGPSGERASGEEERPLYGDRELVASAMLNLAMGALRRSGARAEVSVGVTATDSGMRFRVEAPGAPLQPGERLNVFEPYGRQTAGAAGYGLGLALARAVVELHEGRIWVEDLPGGGCVFVFELGWPQTSARARRAPQREERTAGGDRSRNGEPTVET